MIKRVVNKIKHILRPYIWFLKRKFRKILRVFFHGNHKNSYTFAIVCVKRTPYANLALDNVNSLHYINDTHKFIIYCDNVCEKELKRLHKKFDYPKNIKIFNKFKDSNQPWQYSKIDTIIDASKKDIILIDADSFWYKDPTINKEKITFQVSPHTIGEKACEADVVKKLFNKPEWRKFRYYTSAFIYIPKQFMTNKIAEETQNYLNILFKNKYEFLDSQNKRDEQKRQSEQFAINLALLTHYPKDTFAVLKKVDGAKNTDIVQPLYYGCSHKILE